MNWLAKLWKRLTHKAKPMQVCPVCRRRFVNVERHRARRHPAVHT